MPSDDAPTFWRPAMLSSKLRVSNLPAPRVIAAAWLSLGILTPYLLSVSSAQGNATALIIAPHPDDEVLMVTGIIEEYAPDAVKVAIVTNGDKESGATYYRIPESINALSEIGPGIEYSYDWMASGVHFLGYGDTTLKAIAETPNDDVIITGPHGRVQTYGCEGICDPPDHDVVDYHHAVTDSGVQCPLHGSNDAHHGPYNRETILWDLQHIIETDYPEKVFIPVVYDRHDDHEAAGKLAIEALRRARIDDPTYAPTIYQYLVHEGNDDSWPNRNFGPDTTGNACWEDMVCDECCARGAFLIPHISHLLKLHRIERMPLSSSTQTEKWEALREYHSQIGLYLVSFIKNEEFYWTRRFDSLSYTAMVSVSSEATGQEGTKAIDGIVDGYSTDPLREWVNGQTPDAWIKLDWVSGPSPPGPQWINRIVLYDRPNLDDQILDGKFFFNIDGVVTESETIGPLSDDGSGDIFDLEPPMLVDSVTLEIEDWRGPNTGLAEFEVFLTPCSPPDETVYLYTVTADLNDYSVLHFMDSNQPDQVTGYNIYRSPDPALPHNQWTLLASDVIDMDEGTPNKQWVDTAGDPGSWYYQVAAYNHRCPTQTAEGPW